MDQWQIDDAARLRALFDAQSLTQEAFGERYGIGSQSLVWQYLNGYIPLNLHAAARFAVGLKCEVADFSPRLAQLLPARIDMLEQFLQALSPNDAAAVLDYLKFKAASAPALEPYVAWLDRLEVHPSNIRD